MAEREYGARGRIGVGTPQANATVEPELRALMPPGVALYATRMRGSSGDSRERLVAYIEGLSDHLASFDTLALDAFGFAATGSCYLVGRPREQELVEAAEAAFKVPVVTAAAAIAEALAALGADRIGVLAPYPDWLHQAGLAYWRALGIEVVAEARIETGAADTRSIYQLTSGDAERAARSFDLAGAEALLLSGTGMPTLAALAPLEAALGVPVLSPNLCLARALLRRAGVADAQD